MSYRLNLTDDPEAALQRAAAERLEDAREQLAPGGDLETGVHEARKELKKARALLRLHRGGLDTKTYRRENRALRDAGRDLSELRDAHVLERTVDALTERFAGRIPKRELTAVRRHVAAGRPEPDDVVASARRQLEAAVSRVQDWTLERGGRKLAAKELRRTYARGRTAFERAERKPTDERLHEWRKRAKDLRHQQQLLRAAWPEVLSAQAKGAKRLGDLLGDDHDLALLDERLRDEARFADVRELLLQRRAELQAEAFALGRRIYAESPKRFGKRVGGYVASARREADVSVPA